MTKAKETTQSVITNIVPRKWRPWVQLPASGTKGELTTSISMDVDSRFQPSERTVSPPWKPWLQIYKGPKIRNSQPRLSRWPIQKKRADRRNKIKQKTRDNTILLLFSLVGKEQEKISAFYKLSCNPFIITISLFCDKSVPLGWPWFWQELLSYDKGHIGTLDTIEKTSLNSRR